MLCAVAAIHFSSTLAVSPVYFHGICLKRSEIFFNVYLRSLCFSFPPVDQNFHLKDLKVLREELLCTLALPKTKSLPLVYLKRPLFNLPLWRSSSLDREL